MQLQCIFFWLASTFTRISQWYNSQWEIIIPFEKLRYARFDIDFNRRNFPWCSYLEYIQFTAFCWQTRRIILHLNARGFMIKVFSIPKRFRQFPCCGDSMDCRRCTNFAGRFCVDASGQHSTKLITLDHRLLCLHVGPNIGFLFGVS